MKPDEIAQQIISRLKSPYSLPAIIIRPVKPQPAQVDTIDGQPDELLDVTTPDRRPLLTIWRSYWDEL